MLMPHGFSTHNAKPFFLRRSQTLKDVMVRKVKEIAGRLGLKTVVELEAKRIMIECCNGRHGQGRWADAVSAASVYIACRFHYVALTLAEVADTVEINSFILGRVFNLMVRSMSLAPIPALCPELFLERNASRVLPGMRENAPTQYKQIVGHGKLLLAVARASLMTAGRHPLPIVVAALYLACSAHNQPKDLLHLSEMMNVALSSATFRLRELNKCIKPLTECLPWSPSPSTVKSNSTFLPPSELFYVLQYLEATMGTDDQDSSEATDAKHEDSLQPVSSVASEAPAFKVTKASKGSHGQVPQREARYE